MKKLTTILFTTAMMFMVGCKEKASKKEQYRLSWRKYIDSSFKVEVTAISQLTKYFPDKCKMDHAFDSVRAESDKLYAIGLVYYECYSNELR